MAETSIDYQLVGKYADEIKTYASKLQTATQNLTDNVNASIKEGIEGVDWAEELQTKLNNYADQNIADAIKAVENEAQKILEIQEVHDAYQRSIAA